jgi:hypothetical protein
MMSSYKENIYDLEQVFKEKGRQELALAGVWRGKLRPRPLTRRYFAIGQNTLGFIFE